MRIRFSLKGVCILHELKNSYFFYFIFYNKIEVVKLWIISQIWPMVCFCVDHRLRVDFTFLKVGKRRRRRKRIYNRDFMLASKPKIFTIWLFIEKFVKLCDRGWRG